MRPWQHVVEPLSGYLLLAQKLYEHGENFPKHGISVQMMRIQNL